MKTFITDDFLLRSEAARELYHGYAKDQPIFDYHCHLSPGLIAENYRFRNLYDVWLGGDHYKWRGMRAAGVDERLCTGDAPDREKFLAYAATVPQTLCNPLYHWTHLELLRYFGIDDLLDAESGPAVWDRANELLAEDDFTTQGLIRRSRVTVICTTDDPAEDLAAHEAIRDGGFGTRVYPTFRPDKSMIVDQPAALRAWLGKLEAVSKVDCAGLDGLLQALNARHLAFHEIGGRLSDHGLSFCPGQYATEAEARGIFARARDGQAASPAETDAFAGYMMLFFGRLDAERGWTKQLHLGAQRNNNTRLLRALGPDTGFDSIGDWPQAAALARYLDALDRDSSLPKTIVYNLNPADNYVMAAMIGNFQDGTIAGKVQFGSGWWFLDQKEGMEWQIKALSSQGLLSKFVGMLTDSRSFLSYSRHEYFRRILCNLLGAQIEDGELPRDLDLVGGMVADICYGNAFSYFDLEAGAVNSSL